MSSTLRATLMVVSLLAPVVAQAEPLNDLFSATCIAGNGQMAAVEATLRSRGLGPLDAAVADTFLHGKAGQAWAVPMTGGGGAVAVTEEGLCMVFAQRADVAAVEKTLAGLVASLPAAANPRRVESPSSTNAVMRSQSWAITPPAAPESSILITLSMATSDAAPLQAMISRAQVATAELRGLQPSAADN